MIISEHTHRHSSSGVVLLTAGERLAPVAGLSALHPIAHSKKRHDAFFNHPSHNQLKFMSQDQEQK